MAKTYTADIKQFLDDAGELLEMPSPAHRKAEFLIAIVDAVTRAYPTVGHDIGLRCRKPRSKATILASLQSLDEKITWWCPICEQYGLISDWQGTKWDHTAAGPSGKAEASCQLHAKRRPLPRVHLLLHEAAPASTRGTRHAAIFPAHAAGRA